MLGTYTAASSGRCKSPVLLLLQVDLSQYPGDSEAQQAEVLRIADRDAYNWGCEQLLDPRGHLSSLGRGASASFVLHKSTSTAWQAMSRAGALPCCCPHTQYTVLFRDRGILAAKQA